MLLLYFQDYLCLFFPEFLSLSVICLSRAPPRHIGLYYMGGRISDLPSRQTCGHFCGSNGIPWSVPVLMEFQKQSGMVHITHTNRPHRSWFRRWLGEECQLQYFELFSRAAQVRERETSLTQVCLCALQHTHLFPSIICLCVCVFQVTCHRFRCPLSPSPSSFPWLRCCAQSSQIWTPLKSQSTRKHLSITWAKHTQVICTILPQLAC